MAMIFSIPGDLSATVSEGIGQAEMTMREVWEQYIWHPIRTMTVWDFLDIFLLMILLYAGYLFVKGRRAGKLAIGLGVIFAFYVISDLAGLRAVHRLLSGIAPFAVVLLAVIFQSELRDALEKLGSTPFGFLSLNKDGRDELAHTVSEVVEAAYLVALSETDGAIMVIEGSTALGEYVKNGQSVDAVVSHELLANIFVDRSPLHDGAVIIRKNRVAAAGCKLPLSSNEGVVGEYGTRHRAAVGITENSDCVTVVVSEERHVISICYKGELKFGYNYSAEDLRNDRSRKTIQNNLRNDLFLLLAGLTYEENSRNEKPKFKMPTVKFSWGIFSRKDEGVSGREEPEEVHETPSNAVSSSGASASAGPVIAQFSRARRYDKRTGEGKTIRPIEPDDPIDDGGDREGADELVAEADMASTTTMQPSTEEADTPITVSAKPTDAADDT